MNSTAERSSQEDVSIGPIFYQHLAAYEYAQKFAQDKIILDFGCGEGYGAALLAKSAEKIVGLDYSTAAIKKAKQKYVLHNIEFICSDLRKINFENESFDMIIAFQLIEHLAHPEVFIAKAKAWLKKGGIFLLTTPNRRASLVQHPYHFREYTQEELREFLKKHFLKVELFGLQYSALAAQFRQKRLEESQNLLKLDKLRIHRIIPRFLRQKIFDLVAAVLSKKIYLNNQGLTEGITTKDYWVSPEKIDSGIDLVAVCEKKW